MQISLTPELEKFIQDELAAGAFHSPSELISEALRLLKERESLRRIKLQQLRSELDIGIAQADRGEVGPLDFDALKARARNKFNERKP